MRVRNISRKLIANKITFQVLQGPDGWVNLTSFNLLRRNKRNFWEFFKVWKVFDTKRNEMLIFYKLFRGSAKLQNLAIFLLN